MFIRFLSAFILSSALVYGDISIEEYAAMIGNINPVTHRISTLNHNGSAMCFTTELTQAFLDQCRQPGCANVLEVGCAYGIKSSQIVQTGVSLVANDLEPSHLDKMKATFAELAQSDARFSNVQYLPGNITTISQEELGIEKYDAVLCESVIHFFNPEEVRAALAALYRSLRTGGKIYLNAMSCYYLKRLQDKYERNKAEGMEWPGIFESPSTKIHRPFHLFDEEILIRELKRAGFKPVMCKYIPKIFGAKEFQEDNKRLIIAIAEK